MNYFLVFLVGLGSFLSPCILPLIPVYLTILSGERPEKSILNTVFFVLGFSAVFVGLGATASLLGSLLAGYRDIITRFGGGLVILLGLQMAGVIPVLFFRGSGVKSYNFKHMNPYSASVLGFVFGMGWTPCIGATLGSVLLLAGSVDTVGKGAGLLLIYSLGMAVPFIAISALYSRFAVKWDRLVALTPVFSRIGGGILVVLGFLLIF